MRWLDLRRDLLIAQAFTRHIYIFSLEGCVENGYLELLSQFDWSGQVEMPIETGKKITWLRQGAQSLLWLFSHLTQVLVPIILLTWIFRKRK